MRIPEGGSSVITMCAGDTKFIEVTVTEDNNPVNLEGASIEWLIKKGQFRITKTQLDGIAVSNPSGGVFVVKLSHSDTIGLSGNYFYEGKIIDVEGNVSTVVKGQLYIE